MSPMQIPQGLRVGAWLMGRGFWGLGFWGLSLWGCSIAPPASQFPSAQAAIDRMRGSYECSRGLMGEAKLDYFGDEGRIRASMLFATSRPERMRIDVYSPFGATLSTFTSNGREFALTDVKAKKYFQGEAKECAISRFLGVPAPPQALVQLLGGLAPVLVHQAQDAQIAWDDGAYVLRIKSTHQAAQTIRLLPTSDDWSKPWPEQRLLVTEVQVTQQGVEVYRAELSHHRAAKTAAPRVDPDGLEPAVQPSGPQCNAEVPGRIRFVVPSKGRDVVISAQDVHHNPPLLPGTFMQTKNRGLSSVVVQCDAL
jgi:outer membrane biogenesis lipoprotein LolB